MHIYVLHWKNSAMILVIHNSFLLNLIYKIFSSFRLFQQQLAHQAAIFAQNQAIQHNIQNNIAALSGAAYGGGYGYQPSYGVPNRFGGSTGGTSSFASGGAFAGNGGGGSVGSYGGVRPGGHVYGGTTGGVRPQYSPNYASSGGSVSTGGHHQQHAAIYPANPVNFYQKNKYLIIF